MPIYSKSLASFWDNSFGSEHTLYTVPGPAGPAIIRSVLIFLEVNQIIELYKKDGGGHPIRLAFVDGRTLPVNEVYSTQMYTILDPGESVFAFNAGAVGGDWSIELGGYQFSTP